MEKIQRNNFFEEVILNYRVMKILEKVDEKLKQYKSAHNGDTPLYIQVSTFESEDLRSAIRSKEGLENETGNNYLSGK